MTWNLLFAAFIVLNELGRRRHVKARERCLDRIAEAFRKNEGLELVLVGRDLSRAPASAHFERADGAWAHVEFRARDDVRVTGSVPA